MLGPVSGTHSLSDAAYVRFLGGEGDYLGCVVAGSGDVDGDGVPDVAINAAHGGLEDSRTSGSVHLFLGADLL